MFFYFAFVCSGKHKEASEVGEEALEHLPDSAAIFFNTANALGKIQHFEEAESHYTAALYLSPHNPLYHVNLGESNSIFSYLT